MMTKEEAIEKVRKLLALSQSNNPHEAALAAQRAQEILNKYEIEQGMLDLSSDDPTDKEQITQDGILGEPTQRMSAWKGVLSDALARANACRSYWHWLHTVNQTNWRPARIMRLKIVGRPSDVQKVQYMFSLLVAEVDRLTKRDCAGKGKTYSNNYRHGMVGAIAEKIHEAKQSARRAVYAEHAGDTLALVKIDRSLERLDRRDQDMAQWMKANLKLKNMPSSASHDYAARAHGYRVGKKEVSVNSRARGGLGAAKKALVTSQEVYK
jgi:hypothetical protein